ncbi:MAG TPA: Rid family detoxifying hydrolase [Gemmatimonadota bacterium]|nr:Rid family detoxifying hydrolase [Gemmatimonadota bacterium]
MTRNPVHTDDAPRAIGPYSQAIQVDGWVFTAGQIGADPKDGRLAATIEAQTAQALANLQRILAAAGCGWEHVVKTTVFLRSMADFTAFNSVYEGVLAAPYPARATVGAAGLPKNALIEIEAIAYRDGD